jgi:hypothetical protein
MRDVLSCACFSVELVQCCAKYRTVLRSCSLLRSRDISLLTDYLSRRQRRVLDGVVCFSEVCLLVENEAGISDSDH